MGIYDENMNNKYKLSHIKLNEHNIGVFVINNKTLTFETSIVMNSIITMFAVAEVNNYNITSPNIDTVFVLSHKSDIYEVIKTHRMVMSDIPDFVNKDTITSNKELAIIYNDIMESLNRGEFDFYGIVGSADDDFDIEDYLASINMTTVSTYIDNITEQYRKGQ